MTTQEREYKLDDAPDNYSEDEAMAYVNGANWGHDVCQTEIAQLKAERESLIAERDALFEDSNNYCRILTLLGMEEEGDPVNEVENLISANQMMREALLHVIKQPHNAGLACRVIADKALSTKPRLVEVGDKLYTIQKGPTS